jgi:hypothetical protein
MRRMRDGHLLDHHRVHLRESPLVKRQLTQSVAKIGACVEIHRHERLVRGDRLRQVFLADYIRDDDVDQAADAPRSLGAWPMFQAVVRSVDPSAHQAYALLTGRLVVVHERLLPQLDGTYDSALALVHLPGFRRLHGVTGDVVGALTRCLGDGRLRCLVGTRALLGEGWDAPCVNSLVIASTVGAYMLTNQMRGRALRVDAVDADKVASVWYIVAVALNRTSFDLLFPPTLYFPGLVDLLELEKRFKTFLGIDTSKPLIENSLARLNLPCFKRKHDAVTGLDRLQFNPDAFRSAGAVERWNELMIERLQHLTAVRHGWEAALGSGRAGRIVPVVTTSRPPSVAPFHLRLTLQYFLLLGVAALGMGASLASIVPRLALPIFVLAAVYALPKFVLAFMLWMRHLPVDGTIHQIGLAVRDTLCALRLIDEPSTRIPVESTSLAGEASISIAGGSARDRALFADCLREILSPIENPRFLLLREGRTLGIARTDYHAVPTCLGVKKESAELLLAAWRKRVGAAQLIYTRSTENRQLLGRARSRAFSNAAARAAERLERWK